MVEICAGVGIFHQKKPHEPKDRAGAHARKMKVIPAGISFMEKDGKPSSRPGHLPSGLAQFQAAFVQHI